MMTFPVFLFFAAIAVVSAVLTVVQKNVMHSVLYLAFTVLAIAGVFFTLRAEYLGAIQLLVYGGGIVVLYVFVIIIVNLREVVAERRKILPKIFLIAVPLLLAAQLAAVLMGNKYSAAAGREEGFGLTELSETLLSSYLVPFELASVLLLAVLIGAILIARKKFSHDPD
jgi:NADH-quinone oxidoreductase subunit J